VVYRCPGIRYMLPPVGTATEGTGMTSDPLLDEHRQTWNNFLRFIWGSAAVTAVVLVFIALFMASSQFLG
jgi:hypothetical protein